MKKFFWLQFFILITSLLSGFASKNLFVDCNLVVSNVDIPPFNSLLVYSEFSMADMYSTAQEHIDILRHDAEDGQYDFLVLTAQVDKIDYIAYGKMSFSCKVNAVYEGDLDLKGQNISISSPISEAFYFQDKSSLQNFYKQCYKENYQQEWINKSQGISCFYYSKNNVPRSEHEYLIFAKSCKLNGDKNYYILMDYFDLVNGESVPVIEGRLGQYNDYLNNEVFFQTQEDIDAYYSVKKDILSMYIS